MYVFAITLLLALAVMKVVDLLTTVGLEGRRGSVKILSAMIVGLGAAWALDFSVFAHWGIGVRTPFLGYLGTGLMVAAAAGVCHEVVNLLREYGRKTHDEAVRIEESHIRAA